MRFGNAGFAVFALSTILLSSANSGPLPSLKVDDFVVTFNNNNVSTVDLLHRLNISGQFAFGNLCPENIHSCMARCGHGVDDSERLSKRPCYCDSKCFDVGDCCYNFFTRCSHLQDSGSTQYDQWGCVNINGYGTHGYIMKTNCPASVDSQSKSLCETIVGTDLLRSLPVVDETKGVVYRNVFCAKCNAATSVRYWGMRADCGNIPQSDLPQNRTLLMAFIRENCTLIYTPSAKQQVHLRHCLAIKKQCSSTQRVTIEPLLPELCSFYSFPICDDPSNKNPHCILCNGGDITQYNCGCSAKTTAAPTTTNSPTGTTDYQSTGFSNYTTDYPTTPPTHPTSLAYMTTWRPIATSSFPTSGGPATPSRPTPPPPTSSFPTLVGPATPPLPPPPPLNILFDFSSDSNKISIGDQTTVVQHTSCKDGFVYDPFIDSCRETFRKPVYNTNSSGSVTNSTKMATTMNCSVIRLNVYKTVLYPNGSLWVPLYGQRYNRSSYFLNSSYVFICTNFFKNYTKTENKWSYSISPLQILTYVGCSVSVVSLSILFLIYFMFKDLRTLPGKNLMNLASSMILYHVCLFAAGVRGIPDLCLVIAILLHYFLLTSFAWMSIMAFDVSKTFAFRGKALRPSQTNNNKTLIRYCVCGWGLPAMAVLACVGLDLTNAVDIGYGTGGFCWIANGTILLIVVGVPIAIILLFNFIALTGAIVAIYKVRKDTHQLKDQGNQSSLALLCVKLTSVLGLTWVLGFLNSIVNKDVTAYLFVTVNSLQGFFICVAFIGNKRTLALLKNARKKHQQTRHSTDTLTTKL